MQSAKKQTGFMLLEVLIAILVFSIGVIGLVAAVTVASRTTTSSENRTRAALFANEIISQMWANQTVNIPAQITAWQNQIPIGAAAATNTAGGLSPLPNGVGTVVTNVATNTATVTVTWQEPKSTKTSSYSTQVVIQ
ncbi:type IV pilus modification PilV family protein [Silvimonas soli]|uniref:type IV pilus modification PilV family protein n=1 Tax=Silvimonas soli TaxID=2980100 RepID=UPI0024B3BF2F|nr:hypothetical protein [Silvimonas soli]